MKSSYLASLFVLLVCTMEKIVAVSSLDSCESMWPEGQIDLSVDSEVQREAVTRLRCTLGCHQYMGSSLESDERACVEGCVQPFDNVTLSVSECQEFCLESKALDHCQTGCNVSAILQDNGTALACTMGGKCGVESVDPTSALNYTISNDTLHLHLPPAESLFMTAAESIIVRIKASVEQETMIVPLVNTSLTIVPVKVDYPVCTKLIIDYAAVNLHIMSNFSPPISWIVQPGLVEELSVSFIEDVYLPRHAVMELSWEPPTFSHLLTGYKVVITPVVGTNSDVICQSREPHNTTLSGQDTLSLTVPTANTSKDILYDCKYTINITTFPGGQVFMTDIIEVKYSRNDRQLINVTCSGLYMPETMSYDILVSWEIEPLAKAAVSGYDVELSQISRNAPVIKIQAGTMATFKGFPVSRDRRYFAQVNPHLNGNFSWRSSLLPENTNNPACEPISLLPHPPSSIHSAILSELTYNTTANLVIVSVRVEWEGPVFPNGDLTQIEMKIGLCTEEGFQREWKRSSIDPSVQSYRIFTVPLPLASASELCLQIRSENHWNLFSDWSIPAALNITIPTDVLTDPPKGLATHAVVLIAVGVVLVLAAVFVLAIIACACLRKHRTVRFDPPFIVMAPPYKGSFNRGYGRGSITSQNSRILFTKVASPITDHWEIPTEDLKVFDSQPLGKGAFGEVFKGHVSSQVMKTQPFGAKRMPKFSLACTVAVKRLKDNASNSEKLSFLKEIDMMKKVTDPENEYSQFVVNMIGCVTVREPFLLVLEYVKHGDLLKYLRAMKARLRDANVQAPAPYLEPQGAYSKLNPKDIYEDLELLEEKDLLDFSRQIAAGMEYLSSLDIIHRDLACRNILVGESKNLKISDFGMSRHVPNDEAYVLTTNGQLRPIRWLALESLKIGEYTTASDVWSYGVVLWEICTMGDVPYPVHTNKEVVDQLRRGYRMPKPDKCSPDVYEVMLHCWYEHPADRPDFSELRRRFDHFLSLHTRDENPYIEIPDEPYQFDRLAPETGQVGRNSFLDGGDSPLDLGQWEEGNQGETKRSPNRSSMLSGSMELLEDPSNTHQLHTTHGQPSNERQPSTQDTCIGTSLTIASPSSSLFASDLSIEGDLLQQLDRRLSTISANRIQRLAVNQDEMPSVQQLNEESDVSETHLKLMVTSPFVERIEDSTENNQSVSVKIETDGLSTGDELSMKDQQFEKTGRESLLERKKRDYFKFTLVPTCGVQFNESTDSPQGNREVLI